MNPRDGSSEGDWGTHGSAEARSSIRLLKPTYVCAEASFHPPPSRPEDRLQVCRCDLFLLGSLRVNPVQPCWVSTLSGHSGCLDASLIFRLPPRSRSSRAEATG